MTTVAETAVKMVLHTNPDGSTVEVPKGVKIGLSTHIGPGVSFGDNVMIGAKTRIDENVTIGAGVVVDDYVTIRSGAAIGPNVRIHESVFVGRAADIGSYSILNYRAQIAGHIDVPRGSIIPKNCVVNQRKRSNELFFAPYDFSEC